MFRGKQWAGYVLYFFGFVGLVAMNYYGKLHLKQSHNLFGNYPYLTLIVHVISPVIFGMYLALPRWIRNQRKTGSWTVNGSIVFGVVIPSFFLAFGPLFMTWLWLPRFALESSQWFGWVLGFFLVDAWVKKTNSPATGEKTHQRRNP